MYSKGQVRRRRRRYGLDKKKPIFLYAYAVYNGNKIKTIN